MPTAKAQYDRFGEIKSQKSNFSHAEWDDLHKRVRRELRPFYPHNDVDDNPTFGHPADEWASHLLEVAHTEVSTWRWLEDRLTNEELRAEQADILRSLEKAHASLSEMSCDLHNLLAPEVDVLECRDLIGRLIPDIEQSREKIQVVRLLKNDGIPVKATADKDRDLISPAVKILQVLGVALDLKLDVTRWKDLISKARKRLDQ
jgi:hypothetical protein